MFRNNILVFDREIVGRGALLDVVEFAPFSARSIRADSDGSIPNLIERYYI